MSSGRDIGGSLALSIFGIALVAIMAIAAVLVSNTLITDTDVDDPGKGVTISKVQCALDHHEEFGGPMMTEVPYEFGIRIQSSGDYDGVQVCLEVASRGIVADDVDVKYYDGAEWLSIPMAQRDVDALDGWFEPPSGLFIPRGYDVVVPLCITFHGAGDYSTSVYVQQT